MFVAGLQRGIAKVVCFSLCLPRERGVIGFENGLDRFLGLREWRGDWSFSWAQSIFKKGQKIAAIFWPRKWAQKYEGRQSAFILLGPVLWPENGRCFLNAFGRRTQYVRSKQIHMFQHGHPSMSATEYTNLQLKNSMEYSSLGNGTRFLNTCGTPGGHQKNRSDRENTRFSALQKWCPPLLQVLNINSHESGGHRPLRA